MRNGRCVSEICVKQICINQGVSVQKLDAPVLQKMTCFRACLGTILKALAFCKMGTWAHALHKSFCCPLSFSCWPFKHLKWLPPRNHSDTAGHSTNLFFTLYIRFLGLRFGIWYLSNSLFIYLFQRDTGARVLCLLMLCVNWYRSR